MGAGNEKRNVLTPDPRHRHFLQIQILCEFFGQYHVSWHLSTVHSKHTFAAALTRRDSKTTSAWGGLSSSATWLVNLQGLWGHQGIAKNTNFVSHNTDCASIACSCHAPKQNRAKHITSQCLRCPAHSKNGFQEARTSARYRCKSCQASPQKRKCYANKSAYRALRCENTCSQRCHAARWSSDRRWSPNESCTNAAAPRVSKAGLETEFCYQTSQVVFGSNGQLANLQNHFHGPGNGKIAAVVSTSLVCQLQRSSLT